VNEVLILKKSKFSEEQIVRILQEAASGQKSQAEICRAHNISQNTFYVWKRRYGSMENEDVKKLRELERENAQLKKLLAERDLEVDAIQTLLKKNGWGVPSAKKGRAS
jgi:putative transposase